MPPDDDSVATPSADEPPFVLPADDDIARVRPAPLDALDRPRGGFWGAVGLFVGFEFVSIALAVPPAVIALLAGAGREPAYLFAAHAVTSVLAAFGMAVAAYPANFRRVVALRGCRPAQLVLAVLLAPALVAPADAIADVVTHGLGWEAAVAARPSFFQRLDEFYTALARLPWPLAAVCGCVAPAVGEELLFRGVLGRRLVARYGSGIGVAVTSALFALAHLDPARMAATFVAGIALHGVYLSARSLLPGMALHAVYNALVIGGAKLYQADGWDLSGGAAPPGRRVLLVAVSIAAAIVVGRAVARTATRWRLPDGSDWSPGYETAETPPTELGAAPVSGRPGVGSLAAVGVSLAGLLGAFALAADQPAAWKAYHYRERGDALTGLREYDAAIAAYDEALRVTPRDTYALGNRGMARVCKRDYAAGRDDLDGALAAHPREVEWLVYRGDASWGLGEFDEALADFDAALRLQPGHGYARRERSRLRLQRGIDRQWRGALAGARRDYDLVLVDDPDNHYARGNRGQVLVSQGDYRAGRADLDRALAADPAADSWFLSRAEARRRLGDADGALADCDAAHRLRPKDPTPRLQRGMIFLQREDYPATLAEFDAAAEAGADPVTVAAWRGRALLRSGRYGEASEELESALRQRPGHPSAAYDLAWLRAACPDDSLRDGPQAVTLARGLCESSKWESADPLGALAAAEAECGHFAEAVKHQEKAVRLIGEGNKAFHENALSVYRRGKPYRLDGKD